MLLEQASHDRRPAHRRCRHRQPRNRLIVQLHPAAGRRNHPQQYADTFSRTIAHHSASRHDFTANDEHAGAGLPAPVVSLCHGWPASGCSPGCLSAGSTLLSNVPAAVHPVDGGQYALSEFVVHTGVADGLISGTSG